MRFHSLPFNRQWLIAAILAPLFVTATVFADQVHIDTVVVGNPGNAPDLVTGFGQVDYAYSIAKFEVTVGQYTAFLNAVGQSDPYGLYNASMATNTNIAGIERTGTAGNYSYAVLGSPQKPVSFVDWGDAARFVNWLDNGQPTGPQGPATTEDGAYALNGATSRDALYAVDRNPDATWFLPSADEWYKAAYYDPARANHVDGPYWQYPTRSDSEPVSSAPEGPPQPDNAANFYRYDGVHPKGYNDGYATTASPTLDPSINYLTDVGAYLSTTGPYGTFDQAGNVGEWTEYKVLLGTFGSARGWGGASWMGAGSNDKGLTIADILSNPTLQTRNVGFRVATYTVPEPTSVTLLLLGGVALIGFAIRGRRSAIRQSCSLPRPSC